MGIKKFTKVTIQSNLAAPCPNGIFNVVVTVSGVAGGRLGGTYVASVWDDDWGWDTMLDDTPFINVRRGRFRKRHKFKLSCDPKCNVKGAKGNSNENPANVYGYAASGNFFNQKSMKSANINLTCQVGDGEDNTVSFLRAGGTIETRIGLIIAVPQNAVADDTKVTLARAFEWPEEEYFAPVVGPDIKAIQLGNPEQVFEVPVTLAWPIDKKLRAFLDELDGMFVQFDPETQTWLPIEDVSIGDEYAKFQISRGGLFGIAPHAMHMGGVEPEE